MKSKKNLNCILLTIDALRPDHLGSYGYNRATDISIQPYLKNLAIFDRAYTYSFPTMRAFPVIHSSIWPDLCVTDHPWQYARKITLPKHAKTLAEVFKQNGAYAAAHSCWCNFLTSAQGYGRGVDDFVGMIRQDKIPRSTGWNQFSSDLWRHVIYNMRNVPSYTLVKALESSFHWVRETVNATTGSNYEEVGGVSSRSGSEITDYLLNRLGEHSDEPFFLWGHYLDAHVPLSPPEAFAYDTKINARTKRKISDTILQKKPLADDLRQSLIDLYDGEIRAVFHEVKRVFDALEQRNLLNQTCVVITSDHGFGFWEHHYWEYPEDKFYDSSIRVPLYIYDPTQASDGRKIMAPVSLMDLAPTILDLCGLPAEKAFFGETFAPLLTGFAKPAAVRPIWLETLGPPKLTCRVKSGEKIIYDESLQSFQGALSQRDETRMLELEDERSFLTDLKDYQARKKQFLQKIKT
jgi:arylsulfatase A-like enzyme